MVPDARGVRGGRDFIISGMVDGWEKLVCSDYSVNWPMAKRFMVPDARPVRGGKFNGTLSSMVGGW